MASGDPIPRDQVIYRAVSWGRIDRKSKKPKDTAFLLRPATDKFPAESSLTFGLTPQAALQGLAGVTQTCQIKVGEILDLGHNLTVVENTDPLHVQVGGMPQLENDEGLALTIAKDMRQIASVCS